MKLKRFRNKFISMLLTLAMLLTLFPTAVFAEDTAADRPASAEFKIMGLYALRDNGRRVSFFSYESRDNAFLTKANMTYPDSWFKLIYVIERSQPVTLELYEMKDEPAYMDEDIVSMPYAPEDDADGHGKLQSEEFLGRRLGVLVGVPVQENIAPLQEGDDIYTAEQVSYSPIDEDEWLNIVYQTIRGKRQPEVIEDFYAFGFEGNRLAGLDDAAATVSLDELPAPEDMAETDALLPSENLDAPNPEANLPADINDEAMDTEKSPANETSEDGASEESLTADTESATAILKYQQMDGLNTVLPIGTRKINAFRTLTTESLAVFMPFKVQEIMDRGGIYFGENAISHNLIMCNKANLLNQSSLRLGIPGSGKSFSVKEEIAFLILNTDDDILIADPEGEYAPLIEAMGGLGTVIRVAAGGKDRLNAMYMVDGYGENNPIVVKSQFIMSLVERIDPKGVGAKQKSIIDRCTGIIYAEAEQNGTVPTLATLREKLLEQPETEAREIALALELFTTGSLDIFGHESTVDLDKRAVVFDIHGLGEQLKPIGHLVITDTMLNRVTLNWKRGKRTHVFIDEFHVMFENKFSAAFFNSAWRQFRKRNAYPTAITQNVEYLLDSVQASTLLSNSEFVIMLNQAAGDREKLAHLLNISEEQMSYITNADAGCGLIKYGSALVPFVNRFPADTELYRLMTTKPGEGSFSEGRP